MKKVAIIIALILSTGIVLSSVSATRPVFKFARLKWAGEEAKYNPRPSALARLSYELEKRTSVEADVQTADVEPKARNLYEFPMVFMSAGAAINGISQEASDNIKSYLLNGGFIVIDSSLPEADESIRKFIAAMFPQDGLKKISFDDVLFKTFYLLNAPYGRRASPAYIEGVVRDNRIILLYSQLDLMGALARDAFGNWEYPLENETGEERELAIRFGVNLVMYALCFDYKNDAVHLPFIMKRRR